MTGFEIFSLVLCLIVFLMLTVFFVFLITTIVKLTATLIHTGYEDETIKREYAAGKKKKRTSLFDWLLSALVFLLLVGALCGSLFVQNREGKYSGNLPTLQVVKSGSMERKHEKNTYLAENGLNDQFATFDIILTYAIPAEQDLKLFDVVVYEVEGTLIVHRIIGIEEPTAEHPNERWFVLRGDANERSDRIPVRYSQMRGIYRGEHIPFVGSFILFMHSPAGWLCVLLMLFAMIASPLLDRKLQRERELRWKLMKKRGATVPHLDINVSSRTISRFHFGFRLYGTKKPRACVKILREEGALEVSLKKGKK